MRHYLDGKGMVEIAIGRIREFAEEAAAMNPAGYLLRFSGGKDSQVIERLARMADVPFEASCSGCGGVDPPELIHFIRRAYPQVAIDRAPCTMWRLVKDKGMPPLRRARFCCEIMKERGGEGRFCILGVRWEESARRSKRGMVESCYKVKTRKFLNPIIDWTSEDVWRFIREYDMPYCSLYDEGQKRVGCVLCPMISNQASVAYQVNRWPIITRLWEQAVKATWKTGNDKWKFKSPDDYWNWWLWERRSSSEVDPDNVLFEDNPELNAEKGETK
jgi:phosphoadenosine phosphosulfate reductase